MLIPIAVESVEIFAGVTVDPVIRPIEVESDDRPAAVELVRSPIDVDMVERSAGVTEELTTISPIAVERELRPADSSACVA